MIIVKELVTDLLRKFIPSDPPPHVSDQKYEFSLPMPGSHITVALGDSSVDGQVTVLPIQKYYQNFLFINKFI